jgi:DUF2946 family protein
MRRRRQRRRLAAWLSLFALALQALVPLLVAGEISLAARSGDHSVFELCAFGHVHGRDVPGKATGHDEDGGTVCPICVALHAAPVFTPATAASLPVPAFRGIEIAATATPLPPRLVAQTAYRSRAPPLG